MKYILWLSLIFLCGCGSLGNIGHNYGDIYPEGEILNTACVSVRSFDQHLRSSPQLYGEDSFVGYIDYGPGMPRGHVFLILPVKDLSGTLGEILQNSDPRHRQFWLDAKLSNGQVSPNEAFEAIVPPKQYSPTPNSTIVERETLIIRGKIYPACGKHYLVAVQGNPMVSEQHEWPILRKSYNDFNHNLQWPQ